MKIYWIKAQAPQRVPALISTRHDAECEVDLKGGLKFPNTRNNPNGADAGGRRGAVGSVGDWCTCASRWFPIMAGEPRPSR
jgi:hypothetical protein